MGYFTGETIDDYMEKCRETGRTPEPHILCFGDRYNAVRINGIRAEFNYYAKRHQCHIPKESVYWGFYHKVLYYKGSACLAIYTKDEVFCWDPQIKSIVWATLNPQYQFNVPWDETKSKWRLYLGDVIYGVLIAHGMLVSDLAKYLGFSEHQGYRISGGVSDLSVKRLYLLGEKFDMTIEELLWS